MPFAQPWTDVPSPELERNALRYHWRLRSETSAQRWSLNFAVCTSAGVVGACLVNAADFPAMRTAETGSWIGQRHQGRGIGTEMRAAALGLIFDGLGAGTATTMAWHDNVRRSRELMMHGSSSIFRTRSAADAARVPRAGSTPSDDRPA
jgi:RimJ/RimL family protein N-acetyltransferase